LDTLRSLIKEHSPKNPDIVKEIW